MDESLPQMLLDRARQGDTEALGGLLQLYRNYLRVLVHAVRGPDASRAGDDSDLIQDAIVEAVRGFASFRGSTVAEFRGWLRTVAVRTAKRAVHGAILAAPVEAANDLAARQDSPSAEAMRQEAAARVAGSLSELPEEMQRVLLFRFVDGLDHAAIATLLGKSPGAVRKLFLRALERFREVYRE